MILTTSNLNVHHLNPLFQVKEKNQASRNMSFLLQRRSKAVVPTPDPPVRPQVPDRGVIEASVLVVPPDGLVHKTGMKYKEFNVKGLSRM